MSGKITGSVKWFNEQKGYGFISPDSGGADVFVHVSALKKSMLDELAEGDKVEFNTEPSRQSGKLQACDIKVLA